GGRNRCVDLLRGVRVPARDRRFQIAPVPGMWLLNEPSRLDRRMADQVAVENGVILLLCWNQTCEGLPSHPLVWWRNLGLEHQGQIPATTQLEYVRDPLPRGKSSLHRITPLPKVEDQRLLRPSRRNRD